MASCDEWAALRDSYGSADDFLRVGYLEAPVPLPTGIGPLDRVLSGGLRPGTYILGGEPGAGKSALALQLALMAAQRGKRVLYVSLEMDWTQCRSRCLSLLSMEVPGLTPFKWADVPMMGRRLARSIREGREKCGDDSCVSDLLRADPVAAANAFMDSQCAGLAIADDGSLCDVGAFSEVAWKAKEAGVNLLVVDYLQHMDGQDGGTEYERINAASSSLMRLGRSLGIPLLVLSSLNRQASMKEKPDMHSFRGSGHIEYDTMAAMILRRAPVNADAEGVRLVELHVVKQRCGMETGEHPIELFFDGAHNRFEAVG